MSDQAAADILGLTAQIVAAHVSKNQLETEALPPLIQSVYRSLSAAGTVEAAPAPAQTPAVPIKKSVFPDYIVCLEDGKKLKMLKRHLQTSYGMTPDAYRAKRGLPRTEKGLDRKTDHDRSVDRIQLKITLLRRPGIRHDLIE